MRNLLLVPVFVSLASLACTSSTEPTGGTSDLVAVGQEGASCGGHTATPQTCASGLFCKWADEHMCGAADHAGKCAARPTVCTKEFMPVCGCDGKTYSNGCMAAAAGQSVSASGACAGSGGGKEGDACGGHTATPQDCGEGLFCNWKPEHMCGAADHSGTCAPKPGACAEIFHPVCGCDRQTYPNECFAAAAGQSVFSDGACPGGGGTGKKGDSCGGHTATPEGCAEGLFCQWADEHMCGAADHAGKCAEKPEACIALFDPVCGCDRQTYSNSCMAAAAGQSVFSKGACP